MTSSFVTRCDWLSLCLRQPMCVLLSLRFVVVAALGGGGAKGGVIGGPRVGDSSHQWDSSEENDILKDCPPKTVKGTKHNGGQTSYRWIGYHLARTLLNGR